jgi:hypothetical protein
VKQIIKRLVPKQLVQLRRDYLRARSHRRTAGMSTEEIFTDIYAHNRWGGKPGTFSSGTGTWDHAIAGPYVAAIREWLLAARAENLTAVDLGCGDFHVGGQIAGLCGRYIGVDIVLPLVQHNARSYGSERVEFRHLNLVTDPLPDADICFLRQVLQHLSNEQILSILPKLGKYRWVVVTEHQPSPGRVRVPNLDKPHGGDIRLYDGSGVFLEHPPFSLPPERLEVMLDVSGCKYATDADPGMIRTYLLRNA